MSVQMGNTIDSNGPFNRHNIRAGQESGRIEQGIRPAGPQSANHSHRSASEGHVQFSDTVALLQRTQSQIDSEPNVDSSRVEAAKAAIASGTYTIDHGKIAAALMTLDKELP